MCLSLSFQLAFGLPSLAFFFWLRPPAACHHLTSTNQSLSAWCFRLSSPNTSPLTAVVMRVSSDSRLDSNWFSLSAQNPPKNTALPFVAPSIYLSMASFPPAQRFTLLRGFDTMTYGDVLTEQTVPSGFHAPSSFPLSLSLSALLLSSDFSCGAVHSRTCCLPISCTCFLFSSNHAQRTKTSVSPRYCTIRIVPMI